MTQPPWASPAPLPGPPSPSGGSTTPGAAAPTGLSSPHAAPAAVPRDALDHPIFFRPAPAVHAWRRARAALVWAVGSLVLNLAVWAVVWWWLFSDDPGVWQGWFPWAVGLSVGLSVPIIAWRAARYVHARRALAALHEGLALGVGRGGLFIATPGVRLPWTEVAGLDALPGRLGGSRRLRVRTASGQTHALPLDHLTTDPAALDGAVRAYSAGRSWVELGRLDD